MNIICTGTECTVENPSIIATGQENYFSLSFSFDSTWDSLIKTVYFSKGNIEQKVILTESSYILPSSLTESFGDIYIGITGTLPDNDGISPDETTIFSTNRVLLCSLLQGPKLTVSEIKSKIDLISQ